MKTKQKKLTTAYTCTPWESDICVPIINTIQVRLTALEEKVDAHLAWHTTTDPLVAELLEEKQKWCKCEAYMGVNGICVHCGLPKPPLQLCECYSGKDKQGLLHLHQCDKCAGRPIQPKEECKYCMTRTNDHDVRCPKFQTKEDTKEEVIKKIMELIDSSNCMDDRKTAERIIALLK